MSFLALSLSASAEVPGKDKHEPPEGLVNTDGSINWSLGDLEKKGNRISVLGYKLPKDMRQSLLSNVDGQDLNPLWKKYNAEFCAGLTFVCVGGAGTIACGVCLSLYMLSAMVGTIFVAPFGDDALEDFWAESAKLARVPFYVGIGTTAMTITGVVLLCIGNKGFRTTVDYCNSLGAPRQAYFDFGQTPSGGLGLTFNF